MKRKHFLFLSFILLCFSCGAKKSNDSTPDKINKPSQSHVSQARESDANTTNEEEEEEDLGEVEEIALEDEDIDGQYLGVLKTINPHVTSRITGSLTFSVDKQTDELILDIHVNNAGTDVFHRQNVRWGKRCPEKKDDLNKDGIIDALEGELVYGKIFFPIDYYLPKGDQYGNYIYTHIKKFSDFVETVVSRKVKRTGPDQKLPFSISGKAVIVQGVSETVKLPATVKAPLLDRPHNALPIACGIIQKVEKTPGEIVE